MVGAPRRLRPAPRRRGCDRSAVPAAARGAGDAVHRPRVGDTVDIPPVDHRPGRGARVAGVDGGRAGRPVLQTTGRALRPGARSWRKYKYTVRATAEVVVGAVTGSLAALRTVPGRYHAADRAQYTGRAQHHTVLGRRRAPTDLSAPPADDPYAVKRTDAGNLVDAGAVQMGCRVSRRRRSSRDDDGATDPWAVASWQRPRPRTAPGHQHHDSAEAHSLPFHRPLTPAERN